MDCQGNGALAHEEGKSATAHEMKEKPAVIFVLGGPGSGKGTQCAKIVKHYGFVHLSAGDLLRAEVASGSENGVMLQNMMKEGKIVPAEVTVGLLQAAMTKSGKNKFLIDGFPRDEDNRLAFERATGIVPEFILFFDCPEDVMEKRLLSRGQGRADDNIETIRKRFQVFVSQSVPVVDYYDKLAKVRKIKATYEPDVVFASLKPYFNKFVEAEVLDTTAILVKAADTGDFATYQEHVDQNVTCYEPESQGHLVKNLAYHCVRFDALCKNGHKGEGITGTICSPMVRLLGESGAVVAYEKLLLDSDGALVDITNETRVFERRVGKDGVLKWKQVHFHASKAPVFNA